MIAKLIYRASVGRHVGKMYYHARVERLMGPVGARMMRADRAFYAGPQWGPDEVSAMMARR